MASKLVEIELLKDKSIHGKVQKKGTKHTIHQGVADMLIKAKAAKLSAKSS